MALSVGNRQATSGMTLSIYQAIDAELRPQMEQEGVGVDAIKESQDAWRKLAFAIATGVINHLTSNMEIFGIQTRGDVNASVQGNTELSNPGNHQHNVNLSGVHNNLTLTQSNDGTGHVR